MKKETPGVCKFCGCTDDRACDPPCAWINSANTICSAPPCFEKAKAQLAKEKK